MYSDFHFWEKTWFQIKSKRKQDFLFMAFKNRQIWVWFSKMRLNCYMGSFVLLHINISHQSSLDCVELCCESKSIRFFGFLNEHVFFFKLVFTFLNVCVLIWMYVICVPGDWEQRQKPWWSPTGFSAKSSAFGIPERNQAICPPSATEVSYNGLCV